MKYRFEIESFKAVKKLPRDERNDISDYITSVEVEADDVRKAFRKLAEMSNGRLTGNNGEDKVVMTLPDYGRCQLMLHAVANE